MKKFILKIEKNYYVRFISIIAVVLGAFITIVGFFGGIKSFLYEDIFISKNISDKVGRLSAGQSINYFKQELGSEKIQRKISDKYIEYIFEYKKSFIQSLVDISDNEVVYWAITYCGDNPVAIRRQIFTVTDLDNSMAEDSSQKKLLLNKSKFSDIYKDKRGDFKYFISGATSNSYVYESLYLGNPSAYQTIIIGINDTCPLVLETPLGFELLKNPSEDVIQEFRENTPVNTYGETAQFYGDEILKLFENQHSDQPHLTFGVDRIQVRYFNQ